MKELIIDLTNIEEKENPSDEITDHEGRVMLEELLYDYVGKKIRVRVTIIRTRKARVPTVP